MISTIMTSVHALVATLIFSAAALILLSGPRNARNWAIASILILYGFASVAFGLGLNSISMQQATPWIVVELIATYSSAPAAFLVATFVLRPKVAKSLYVAIPLWIFILIPPFLSILDLTNLSQTFFASPILLSLEKMNQVYTGGYISIQEATTKTGIQYLLLELIFFYSAWIFYPNLYVYFKDRKTDRANSINAFVLFIASVLGAIFISAFVDTLPITVAPLITNGIISIGFFIIGLRSIRSESQAGSEESWLQIILKNYPMFTKLASTIGLIVIPAIVFITFSSFSFFQNSLLSVANENLMVTAHHGADSIVEQLNDEFHTIEHLNQTSRIQTLLKNREKELLNLEGGQIRQYIENRNDRWTSNDLLLVSIILDPVNSNQLKFLIEENPNFLELVVVDLYGGLVTASKDPQKFDFSDETSWQVVSNQQKLFIGQPLWEEEIDGYLIEFALPIHDDNENMLGVIIGKMNITGLVTSLQSFEQNNIQFGLASTDNRIIPSNAMVASEFTIPTLPEETMMGEQDWQTFQIIEQSFLLRTVQVAGQEFEFNAPWKIIAYQPVDQALAPLKTATITAAITAGIIITISSLIIISLSQSIARPLTKLTTAATKILEGDTQLTLDVGTSDELGTLATSFNQMSSDLNTLLESLEGTIAERTEDLQKRAVQLEASAVVARQAAEVRDVATLLDLVVNLIPEKFNYYHAGIFLLDEYSRYAVLQAANSEGGKRMLARNHKLQVGRVGVVGYVAGMGQPRIAQDVGADIVYYDNPDMPDTRSEMALPLKVRDRVIGVLDVQSTQANAFTQEDIEVLQVLADQVALAIDNARLFENSQRALEELQTLYGQDTARAWRQRLTGREISYMYDSTGITKSVVEPEPIQKENEAFLSKPISLRGQIIGNLSFMRDGQDTDWSEDEAMLIEEILDQTALALENARLVNQIRLRSDQIQLLQEISAMAASTLNEKELLENGAQKLQSSLNLPHCGIVLFDEEQAHATLVASASSNQSSKPGNPQIRLEDDAVSKLVIQKPHIFSLATIDDQAEYQTFKQFFSSKINAALTLLPLTIREQVVGYIFLENEDLNRTLDLEEENLFRQISAQISTAMESARLFAAEQEGRIAAAALLEITQIASASLDMNQVLNQATNRSAHAIQAHRCTIFLLDEKEKIKPLISIYADGSEMPEEEWDLLQKRVRETYEHFPLHRLAANLRTPRIISDPLTYSNLPLYWTEDFKIQNMLMVPLISQNKVIGSMIFDQIDRNLTFKKNQEALAQTIAGQIATTIENANLFEQAVHRAERERQVSEITAKIRSSNDPKQIMETAISELRKALAQPSVKAKPSKPEPQPNQETNLPGNGKDEALN